MLSLFQGSVVIRMSFLRNYWLKPFAHFKTGLSYMPSSKSFFFLLFFFFLNVLLVCLRQGLSVQPRSAFNLQWSSCLSFLNTEITSGHCHTYFPKVSFIIIMSGLLCTHLSWHVCKDQRKLAGVSSLFLPSTCVSPGIHLRLPSLRKITLPVEPSHLPLKYYFSSLQN